MDTTIVKLKEVLKNTRHTDAEDVIWKEYLPELFNVFSCVNDSLNNFFVLNNFSVCTPSVLAGILGACENFDTVYRFKRWQGGQEFLSQTAQLQLERLLSFSFDKVSCVTKSFRQELNVSDGRHLKEFTLVELEMANCNLNQLLDSIESLVKKVAESLYFGMDEGQLVKTFGIDIGHKREKFLESGFPRVSYSEAIKMLIKRGFAVSWGDDLKKEHEKEILSIFKNIPVFLTHFPEEIKFFNMKVNEGDPRIVNSADLLLPFSGEAVGSSERECDFEKIEARLKKSVMYKKMLLSGIKEGDFGCYLKVIQRGVLPDHSGCGIGLERLVQSLLSQEETDIRFFSQSYILNRVLGIG